MSKNQINKKAGPSASKPYDVEKGLSKSEYSSIIDGAMEDIMYGWGGASITNVNVTSYGVDFEAKVYGTLDYAEEEEEYSEEEYSEYEEPEDTISWKEQDILNEIEELLNRLAVLLKKLRELNPDQQGAVEEKDHILLLVTNVKQDVQKKRSVLSPGAKDSATELYLQIVVDTELDWSKEDNSDFNEKAEEAFQKMHSAEESTSKLWYVIASFHLEGDAYSYDYSYEEWKGFKKEWRDAYENNLAAIGKLTSGQYSDYLIWRDQNYSDSLEWHDEWQEAMLLAKEEESSVKPRDFLMSNGSPIPNRVFLEGFIDGIKLARKQKAVQDKYGYHWKTKEKLPSSEIFKKVEQFASGWSRNIDEMSKKQADTLNGALGLRKPKAKRSGVASPHILQGIWNKLSKLKGVNKKSLPSKGWFLKNFGFSEGYQDQDSNEAYAHANHSRKSAKLLRQSVIRLASEKPELRAHLLPLLVEEK